MKYAWVENNVVLDIAPGEPSLYYTPEIAAKYSTVVDDSVTANAQLVNGAWVSPVFTQDSDEVAVPPRTWTADNIRAGLTLAERVKWDSDSAPEVVTAKQEMAVPQELAHTTEVLEMLVGAGVITQASMNKILA